MKRKLLLVLSSILLILACKGNGKGNNIDKNIVDDVLDDVSLVELTVNGESVLEKLDKGRTCTFGEVDKYSVEVNARSKTENAMITVGTGYAMSDGSVPNFRVYLDDGENVVKVVSISPRNRSNRKDYTIKITKKASSSSDTSYKLAELNVDSADVLSKMEHNACTLSDVRKEKESVQVKVKAENPQTTIKVTNKDASVREAGGGVYDVALLPGLNAIKVILSSGEGDKCYSVNIYREEDLTLETFKIGDKEYYDAKKDRFSKPSITFEAKKQQLLVKAKTKADGVYLSFKVNGHEVSTNEGTYVVNLGFGKNNAEVMVVGGDEKHSRVYPLVFYRESFDSNADVLVSLKAEDVDLLPLLSSDKSVILETVPNEKTSLKLEAKSSSASVRVKNGSVEVTGNDGIFDVPLNDGSNRISVLLYNGDNLSSSYSVFVTKNPKPEDVPQPASDEVTVTVFVSDGVNGSPVNGTKLNIFKTKGNSTIPLKTLTVIDGKAKVNLAKADFYDFRLEGLSDVTVPTRYAASDVISLYIDENKTFVPMVQCPLLMVTRPTRAPEVKEFKFGSTTVAKGGEIKENLMKNVTIKLRASSFIEETPFGTPGPMLGIGFVPAREIPTSESIVKASSTGLQAKVATDEYESGWVFNSNSRRLIKGDAFDIVVVVYDKAANRLEYHSRMKTSDATKEDDKITVGNLKLQFKRLPTPSPIFSVGKEEATGSSTYYNAVFKFDVKKGGDHIDCVGFDLYRRCVSDAQADFQLVKHFVCEKIRTSSDRSQLSITDSDGVLEDEKKYEYKIVAYTTNDSKSTLSSSSSVELVVPKSNTVLLHYPLDVAVAKEELEKSGFKFRLTNPKLLKDAKEMKAGFILTNRTGTHYWGSKFKYVFNDAGKKPELYFAKRGDESVLPGGLKQNRYSLKRDEVTSKSVDELISVDKETGEVTIHNAFFGVKAEANLAAQGAVPPYNKGDAYYWDIVDFGANIMVSDDDTPLEIVSNEVQGVTIISPANDLYMGNNAWNGRAEFTIK